MFIWQDQVGGLEVQNHQGEWVTAHPIEGTLVVNVGDLLMRWSNDVFRSTPHRVINRQSCERYSMVVAWDPDFDTLIEPALFGRISPDSIEAGFSPEYSLEFPELVSSPWLCSDGAERPDDPPVCGDTLDLPGYDEVRGTRYCGFDPSQSQWISVIFLAFS